MTTAQSAPPVLREDLEAVGAVLRSGWLTMGPRTADLEAVCAQRLGVGTSVAVASGPAALHLAFDGLGIGPGHEVIVPGIAGLAPAGAAHRAGATAVVADIVAPGRPVLDPASAAAAITPDTRAVCAVHPWGHTADVHALRALCDERGILLLEYAPNGLGPSVAGRPVGTFGAAGCFGLLPGGGRDAGETTGLLVTDDVELGAHARSRRSHAMTAGTWARHTGRSEGYDVEGVGFNYRIDETRSALALSRLDRIDDELQHCRALAREYRERLSGLDRATVAFAGPDELDGSAPDALPVVLRDARRAEELLNVLWHGAGIEAHRPVATPGALPTWARAAQEALLVLPLHAGLSEDDVERVCAALEDALA